MLAVLWLLIESPVYVYRTVFRKKEFIVSDEKFSGADLLIDALQANGLNNMYGIVGIPVTDFARLAEIKGMKYYGFRREDAAVDAAAAAGFITGKPGVALTVSAPGFLNGLTALAQATKNCFPLIMISGSSERHIIDLDRGDYEGLDQYNVAKPFCKAAYRVDRAQDMGLAVARAIRTAVSGRPGGVYLDLPAATIADMATKEEAGIFEPVDPAPAQLPSDDAIKRAADLLKNAKQPVILLGKGAAYAQAEDEVKDLVESTKIPFLPMSMAKGILPDTHPSSAVAARSLSLGQADVVLLIGARLNWMLSNGQSPLFNENAKFIQIEIDATEFDSNRKIDAPLQGDIKSVLQKLNAAVKSEDVQAPQAWLDTIGAKVKENNEKFAARVEASHTSTFGYYSVISPINDLMQKHPDTYIVSEGANALDIGRDLVDMDLPRHRLDTGTWGVMGVALGYGIAAAVETGRPVIAIEGDSGFGFDAMEIETICRYNLPITIVVINNGGIYNGDTNPVKTQLGPTTLDPTAHYEYLSKAFGGNSYFVDNYEDMKKALNEAYESGKPSIINAQIPTSMGIESGHIGDLNPEISLDPADNK